MGIRELVLKLTVILAKECLKGFFSEITNVETKTRVKSRVNFGVNYISNFDAKPFF